MVSLALDVLTIFFILRRNHIFALLGNSKIAEAKPAAVSSYPLLLFWQNNGGTLVQPGSCGICRPNLAMGSTNEMRMGRVRFLWRPRPTAHWASHKSVMLLQKPC